MHIFYYYGLLIAFAIVAYMIVADRNVAEYLVLLYRAAYINIERIKWLIVYHPKNPITNWLINRKFRKFINEMSKVDNSQSVHFE